MLLIVGIDGLTPDLLERLASTGQMPTVRSLMRHGVYGRLHSSINVDSICAWSSVLTGVNPGKHGVWGLHNLVPESYQWRAANSRMLRAPTITQLLGDRGRKVGSFFVPMTFPAPEADWTTVSGWLAPSPDAEGFAHPRRVRDLARRHLKDAPLMLDTRSYALSGSYEAGVKQAIAAMQAKVAVAEELIAEDAWDLFMIDFNELERILRWYWHLFDRQHVDFRSDLHSTHGKLIAEIHRAVDEIVGRLAATLGPRDQLMLISPCGMQINNRVASCIPSLMTHLGLLKPRSSAGGWWHSSCATMGSVWGDAMLAIREILPTGASERLPESAEAEGNGCNCDDSRIDYERSWVIPSPGGHLYLNIEGEFPLGRVDNGQLDRLVMQISAAVQSAIDPSTGQRPLEWAKPREAVCAGPYVNRIPHLVTRFQSPRVATGLTATGADGRVRIVSPPAMQHPSGAPGPHGVIIAAGAGIRRGARIEGAQVEDVTATAVYLADEQVPRYFDGRVLEALIASDTLGASPIRYVDRDQPRVIEDGARVLEASQAVESHLGSVGEEV